jgi:hypothetical protein
MLGKGDAFAEGFLGLILNGTTIAGLARDDSGGITITYVGLHTASPEGGDQTTSEATFAGYSRVEIYRDPTGWTGSGRTWTNVNTITFPMCESGSEELLYFTIGTEPVGAGLVLWTGTFSTTLEVTAGVTLFVAPGNLIVTED